MFADYERLLARIDNFFASASKAYPTSVFCKHGCRKCCVSGINVFRVEFDRIATYVAAHKRAMPKSPAQRNACGYLKKNGLCAIYDVRPAVCRMGGLPLLYDANLSEESRDRNMVKLGKKTLAVCDLNFRRELSTGRLEKDCVLDAEVVLTVLSAINSVYCKKVEASASERVPIAKV